jgi:glycosyltransferase involved in cell wall biosynthesis
MKVAHVTPSYYPAFAYGGPPESAHQLSRHLARAGCDVRVLTTDANGKTQVVAVDTTRELEIEPRLRVRYCARRVPESVSPALLGLLPGHLAWCDVVHLNAVYNFTTLPALAAARAAGKPVVWSARGALQRWERVRLAGPKAAWELVCRALAPRRTVIHVTSEGEEQQTAARMPGLRTALVPNGVEIPPEAPRPPPSPTLRMLYLGRIHPIKGIENLIGACAELGRRGGDFTLAVAGGGEPGYVAGIRRRVADHGLDARVTLLGEVPPDRKDALFAAADLLVAPSFTENFGLAIAEALAHGVPVVAGRGTPWARLEEHDAGRWVPNDAASLADAIAEIRERPLVEMGARGRAWVAREFSWGRVAGDMCALYERLVAEAA